MNNYKNYSKDHYEAAEKIFAKGNISKSAALYMTQSNIPNETRIKDELEMLYPTEIKLVNINDQRAW